jgi:hypothetical protein
MGVSFSVKRVGIYAGGVLAVQLLNEKILMP